MLVIVLLLTFSSCSSAQVESKSYALMLDKLLSHTVNEKEVADLVDSRGDYIFLDARELREYEVSHIGDAIYIGYDQFDSTAVADLEKDAKILVYCSVGYRSEKIAERLMAMGYSDVHNLYGGIFEWKNRGLEVVDQNGVTDNVHAYSKTWGIWLEEGNKVYE